MLCTFYNKIYLVIKNLTHKIIIDNQSLFNTLNTIKNFNWETDIFKYIEYIKISYYFYKYLIINLDNLLIMNSLIYKHIINILDSILILLYALNKILFNKLTKQESAAQTISILSFLMVITIILIIIINYFFNNFKYYLFYILSVVRNWMRKQKNNKY